MDCIWARGGGILGIYGWGCAAGTLEPLAYTRASSAEFCYPILEYTSQNHSYPVAFYDGHLSTLLRRPSRENMNLPISLFYMYF